MLFFTFSKCTKFYRRLVKILFENKQFIKLSYVLSDFELKFLHSNLAALAK